MDLTELLKTLFMCVYTFGLIMVSIYGLHRYVIVFLYYRHKNKHHTPAGEFEDLPHVTVQLPMFNERLVARRIIEKTCEIDYPRDKMQIQVLDDSTDDTQEIALAAVEDMRRAGFDIEYIHRDDRTGFKAGALKNGLKTAKGEFITIFDADFIPAVDVLKNSIHFFTDPKVCVVQTRWEHINHNDSMLTRSQAIFLDGHFAIEHVARNRSERFMSFNGTGGTWRRAAIDDAGGWHHDTLTEDLDLSYRAQMKGWKFIFLPNLIAPAELPPEMNAFKAQQFRWTKGGAQCALKLLPKVFLSKIPLKAKVEGFFHLTSFTLHLYMIVLVGLMYPAMYLRTTPMTGWWRNLFDMSVFTLATLSASVFYIASQVELLRDWRKAFKFMPMLMALGVGLCVSNTKGVLEALFGKESEFVRTPKYGSGSTSQLAHKAPETTKKKKINLLPYFELAFGIYMGVCAYFSAFDLRSAITTPFLLIFTFGFFYVSMTSFYAQYAARKANAEIATEAVKVKA